MRKNLLLFFALLLFAGLNAQTSLPGHRITMPGGEFTPKRPSNPELLNNLRRSYSSLNSGSRATTTKFVLDYDIVDNEYANVNTQDYQQSLWSLNRRFPNDSSFTTRWACVVFDTLFDFVSNPVYPFNRPPMSAVRLNIDTVRILYAHVKNITTPGHTDSIRVRIFDGDSLSTLYAKDGCVDDSSGRGASVLYERWFFSDSSLTGRGTTAGTYRTGVLDILPNLLLRKGQTFAVQVDFYGPVEDEFFYLAGYRDGCGGNCAGMNSIVPSRFGDGENSHAYFIYKGTTTAFQTFSHFVTIDCSGNGTVEDALCENFYIQNINFIPYVTATIDLSASVTADRTEGCPGDVANINLEVYGATGTPTVTWSPATGLSSATGLTPIATIGDSSITYVATIINGTDTVRTSIRIKSNGIKVNAGADRPIACGATTNLAATISGNVTGANYIWSNGPRTAANNGVVAGTYRVTVTNSAGCSSTDDVVVSYPGITQVVSFNVPSPICVGRLVTFPNTSLKKSGWNFTWTETVSGNTNFLVDGQFTFATAGAFTMRLTADSAGCAFNATSPITVRAAADPLCTSSSVGEVDFNQNVSIFPNPTEGSFQLNVIGSDDKMTITIFNMNGAVVYNESSKGNTYSKTIDMSGFANGIYYVKVQNGSNVAIKKLTIN